MILVNPAIALSMILFTIGLVGVLTRRNLIMVFISVELMLNAVNLNIVAMSRRQNLIGAAASADSIALFVILLAACEVAVGLGILLKLYRLHGSVDGQTIEEMKE